MNTKELTTLYDLLCFYEKELKYQLVKDVEKKFKKFKLKNWQESLSSVTIVKAKGNDIPNTIKKCSEEEIVCYNYPHINRVEIMKHIRNSFAHGNLTIENEYIVAEDFEVKRQTKEQKVVATQTAYFKMKLETFYALANLLS